ncbi:MAG TPA: D-alanyl-D-alanine carboxypeptidase/D-alanyl-D-alanine-endopeptidase [Candidatus Nanopelagicales bacterium]|nr:D-alanyl-D-alanine carboxypeptidase/D-alanyl-D-alanine-endopeptidase [Candidatus Nanopelagicales bacterium]
MSTGHAARRTAPVLLVAALSLGLLATAASGAGSTVPPAPSQVLAPTSGATTAADPASDARVAAGVRAALAVKAVGADTTSYVLDVGTGKPVYAAAQTRAQIPASTLKVLTAAAALQALGPQTRLSTTVVPGKAAGEIVLVGGGDATLTRNASARTWPAGQPARPASIAALATATAAALTKAGTTKVVVHVDDSLFTGPRTAPGWPATFTTGGVVAPVTALSVDQGRSAPGVGSGPRVKDPSLEAGRLFAERLRAQGITVTGTIVRVVAPSGAQPIASVLSPTVADLVERMLTQSDDDLAEALAHLAGGKLGGAASFAGGADATLKVLSGLGVTTTGAVLVDGSGLSGSNKVSAATIVGLLAALATTDDPALSAAVTGLAVAGATGTLEDRFDAPATRAGRGLVLAKTGTLTGVNALAGLVLDPAGRLRAFAFLEDGSPGPQAVARTALDRAAAVVAAG